MRAVVTEAAARCEVERRDPLGCWSLCGQGPSTGRVDEVTVQSAAVSHIESEKQARQIH